MSEGKYIPTGNEMISIPPMDIKRCKQLTMRQKRAYQGYPAEVGYGQWNSL